MAKKIKLTVKGANAAAEGSVSGYGMSMTSKRMVKSPNGGPDKEYNDSKDLEIKKGVGADATKLKSPAPKESTPGGYKLEDAGYRGSRIRIKLKNPKGFSGKDPWS